MPDTPPIAGVPFSFFASLVRNIAAIQPSSNAVRAKRAQSVAGALEYPAATVFHRWAAAVRSKFSPLPAGTTAICFRLLFPEEDVRRKYDIQEPRMTKLLADCFGIDSSQFEKWGLEMASGCLGSELKVVLEKSCPHPDGFISPMSIAEVDALLDELSALSGFTHPSIRAKYPKPRRSRAEITRALFRTLAPEDAAILTQIVLKDLKPLLYPLSEFHYTIALTRFNTAAVKMLTKEHAMDVWDPTHRFLRFYRVRATLDEAAAFADLPERTSTNIQPTLGSPIAVPKSEKGLSCTHALDFLYGSDTVWAETKYDGERAQIHVEILPDGSSHITIFSKSKRDSTQDRHAVHHLVRAALGLSRKPSTAKVRQNVILDAEMVAFRGEKVAEFWHIRQLVEDTAHGIRGRRRSKVAIPYEHESMNSEENEGLSLGLVFFDILYLDSRSLLGMPYSKRRALLEAHIRTEPGKAILADRYPINMSSTLKAEDTLRRTFAAHIAQHEEGLVLKASDARYNDYRKPWVKLKKDYIPGHGDCLDMVILGASWEKVRGRSLRVSPSAYTTFYVGALENKKETFQKPPQPPKFHVYFTVSYGLDRKQLEDLNFWIKSSDPIPYASLIHQKYDLPFRVTVFQGLKPPPTVILRTPLVAELFGAGFTKAAHSQYYELRFPRIQKLHRPSERDWRDAVTLEKLHDVACKSVGREQASKETNDMVKALFGLPLSPSINSHVKREERMREAYAKLAESEGVTPSLLSLDKFVKDFKETQESPCSGRMPSSRAAPSTPLGQRQLRPLGSKTNVFHASEESAYMRRTIEISDQVKSTMELIIPGPSALLTPPNSSPPKRPASARVHNSTRPSKKAKITKPPSPFPPPIAPNIADIDAPEATVTAASPTPSPFPPDMDDDRILVWFSKSTVSSGVRPCATVKKCRASLTARPVHCLDSLLAGCGWTDSRREANFLKGIIIIDECDVSGAGMRWREWIRRTLSKEAAEAPQQKRIEVLVYGCTSGLLDRFA
ncbi:hypothetical protein BDN70DRAFT_885925 [Pholiota conissans]|uniref:ATP-dependent DNA ligase family profile domain-containing protein n=1 Tax=Pholiota conissans TaxID=109636 RepID=A0A9P5YP57_9AGAR|nr:hypothetical protein BDN70DRAFT_885925 [Pholiota conissans]